MNAIGRLILAVALAITAALLAPRLAAHELQPAFLDLREGAPGTYALSWKLPSIGRSDRRMPIAPVFPASCRLLGEARSSRADTAWIDTATLECPNGLAGQILAVDGLSAFATDVLVRVQHHSGRVETHVLKPLQPSVTLQPTASTEHGAGVYFRLGVEHILTGFDHLLFVLGLLLIVRDRWMLIKTVSAFTLAHSITLAAATVGQVAISPALIEALIALSILFLALEIVRRWRGGTSFTIRHPWAVAFAFGLLHGLGFASGLLELGIPKDEIPLALLLFNLGVEAGQLGFVAVILALESAFHRLCRQWPAQWPAQWLVLLQRLPGYWVGSLGAFWAIQRIAMLFKGVV
ncbi:MAG: HupE/UreJ family protein [Burkholderiaceae bacterium]